MKQVTFSAAVDEFTQYKRLEASENTISDYSNTYRKLASFLRLQKGSTSGFEVSIRQITHKDIIAFLNGLREVQEMPGIAPRKARPLGKKTLRNIHAALSSFWKWAVLEGYAESNILERVPRPRGEKRAVVPFTREDIIALLEACDVGREYTHWRGCQVQAARPSAARDKAIIKLLLDTGLRASELCGVRVLDFDARNKRVKVMGKGSKERLLRIDTSTVGAIVAYLERRKGAQVVLFVTSDGERGLNRKGLRLLLRRVGLRAGVQNVYPHRFRHTFAVNFLRNGASVYALKAMLGHTTLQMCERYLEIAQADIETAHRLASPVAKWGV